MTYLKAKIRHTNKLVYFSNDKGIWKDELNNEYKEDELDFLHLK